MRETYVDDALSIDFAGREVRTGETRIELTPLEFRLLAAFVRHPSQVLSRERVLELVWGDTESVAPSQVKLYVGYLRRKLGWESEDAPLETVRGFGYRYRPAREPAADPA